ncbi:MAG TPA: tRNA (guanosine(37)-N1)-methyltransferase TrmD [Pseudomonadales bacterium]|jgi:tRNA (guanine37-N1)-methyltransferase|nr:tRNA (guanosine(37)-N1)-methyltransferase TrmD [Pseudomonadales bacterium]
MWVGVVSIFPDMFRALTSEGVVARAIAAGTLVVDVENPRNHADDRHSTVDDRPYGGGPGMVMKVEPLERSIAALKQRAGGPARTIYLSPQGEQLQQRKVESLAREERLVFVAGRYEGIDERVIEASVDEQISLGDFVLTGGELPVMVVIDAVARYLPGTLGNAESAEAESHRSGLLDWAHYTRPDLVAGRSVPPVLLGGDHETIRRFRLRDALGRTYERRPDLLSRRTLSDEERRLLSEYLEQPGRVDASRHMR